VKRKAPHAEIITILNVFAEGLKIIRHNSITHTKLDLFVHNYIPHRLNSLIP